MTVQAEWTKVARVPTITLVLLALTFGFPTSTDAEVERVLEEEQLTGAVWATIAPEGVSLGAAGIADAADSAPMSVENKVHVGSVAKTVLALGVLRLVTEGRLSLDAPVAELLPELRFDNPWADTDPIRVHHLLSQTSGLDNLRFWQVFSRRVTPDAPLHTAFDGDSSLLRLRTRPGTRFSYSNMGYTVLGMVIEAVTGKRYEAHLDDSLLRPLGMSDSTFAFVTQEGDAADRRLAMGHFEGGARHAALPMFLRPASQFTTTTADMARFAQFLLGDGTLDGEPFVDRALLERLATPEGTEAARAGLKEIGHGLALARRDRHGVVGDCHPGATVGFVAMLCVFPRSGHAYFWATNTDSETANNDKLNKVMIDALRIPPRAPMPHALPDLDPLDWAGLYLPAPNNMARFAWVDATFNFVTLQADSTTMRLGGRELIPVGGNLFRASDRTIPSHVLYENRDGIKLLSNGLRTYEKTSWVGLVLRWASLTAGLSGLVYLLVVGVSRRRGPIVIPALATAAVAVPVPLFFLQSFTQLGDPTVASIALAAVTVMLPFALVIGLAARLVAGVRTAWAVADVTAMALSLQFLLVLASAKLIPLVLFR